MSRRKITHGQAFGIGGEFTICGLAFDNCEGDDDGEEIVFAKKGEVFTCPDCLAAVAYYKSIRRNRQP